MKRVAFAMGLLALGFTASTPAKADFAVVKYPDGYCRVWTDTADHPWGGRFLWFKRWHHHWSYRTHTWERSEARLHRAVWWHRCHHWW